MFGKNMLQVGFLGAGAVVFGGIFAVVLPACGGGVSEEKCNAMQDATKKDWCIYELAVKRSEDNDLEGAGRALQNISDPMVRSAATDKVIMQAPDGMDQLTIQNMCASLPNPYQDTCMRTWNRPHLWQSTGK